MTTRNIDITLFTIKVFEFFINYHSDWKFSEMGRGNIYLELLVVGFTTSLVGTYFVNSMFRWGRGINSSERRLGLFDPEFFVDRLSLYHIRWFHVVYLIGRCSANVKWDEEDSQIQPKNLNSNCSSSGLRSYI